MIENEEIVMDNQDELEISGRNEEQVYPMDNIKVDKGFYSVFELKRRYDAKEKRIILDSDFQREGIWRRDRKSELIESVLMGLPLPVFYFSQDRFGKLIVIDGRQRLTALFEYMNDKYPLRNLSILKNLNGKYFSKLIPVLSGKIEDYQIQAHVIMPPTPDRIKFDIFDRVNRGGMQLNKQEMRNALYQGRATRLINSIVKSQAFREATGNAFERETRMKDRYLITRFLTFYLQRLGVILGDDGEMYQYKDDIDEFLGKGMAALNNLSDSMCKQLEELTVNTLEKSFFYLGKDAFRKAGGEKKSPINMNVFETIMFIMLFVPGKDESKIAEYKASIEDFVKSEAFMENIGNHRDSAWKLKWRIDEAERIGKEIGSVK